MKYQFIEKNRSTFAVPGEKMCRAFKISKSGYYAQNKRGRSKQAADNEKLVLEIRKAHKKSYAWYGSPRITEELNAKGAPCSKNRVARRMRKNGIVAKTKKRSKLYFAFLKHRAHGPKKRGRE